MSLKIAYESSARQILWQGDKIIFRGEGLRGPKTLLKDGQLTRTGRALQAFGWNPPHDQAYPGLATEMHGKREYVHMPSGRTALSRTWRQGRWDLTDIGKQLYRNETEVVVEVPVRIQSSGAREWHTDNTWLPVSSTMAPRLPDLYPNAAAIKAYIRSLCEVHADGHLILTVSDALYFISEVPPRPRDWRISTQRILPDGTV